ncbi:MAG: TSUP family transporter, partial [Pseudomonadota bacterium]|nr:TSUP family transporter [Pseudomonadota bacterium]
IIGSLIHLTLGSSPHWQTVAWAAPGVLIGGQIGPRITGYINERMLKEVFIFMLTLIGIHLIYNAF